MNSLTCVVILNWNGWRDTIECISSVVLQNSELINIVVVDNDSKDDSLSRIHEWANSMVNEHDTDRSTCFQFEELLGQTYILNRAETVISLHVLRNNRNAGFSGGCNIGIRFGRTLGAKYYWLLNNDAQLERNCTSEMIRISEDHDDWIIASPLVLKSDSNQVYFAGAKIDTKSGNITNAETVQKLVETDYICGCAMFIPSKVIDAIGLLDESYFMYYEDTDYSIRAKGHGVNLIVTDNCVAHHKVAASTAPKSPQAYRMNSESRIYFVLKHSGPYWGILATLRFLTSAAYHTFNGRFRVCSSLLHGVRAAWYCYFRTSNVK